MLLRLKKVTVLARLLTPDFDRFEIQVSGARFARPQTKSEGVFDPFDHSTARRFTRSLFVKRAPMVTKGDDQPVRWLNAHLNSVFSVV
jgi:hypothetical protein